MNIKRVYLSLIAIAMVSLTVSAASFALFSAESANTGNTFTTGTVGLGAPVSTIVNVANIAPGDSDSETYSIQYTGSLDAFLGVSTTLTGDLITCGTGAPFFHASLSDGAKSYNMNLADQVAGVFVQNQTLNLSLGWNLDLAAPNECQAKSAQISLQVKAVQARNNDADLNGVPDSWGS